MSVYSKRLGGIALGSLLALACLSQPARAYGPEGLFGGRPMPDSTVNLNANVQPEDRPDRAQSVLQHPRPDYDPVPVTVASFDLYPSVEFGAAYDTNAFAAKTNAHDDGIFNTRPAVSAASNWNRHALQMTSYADFNAYRENDASNFNNYVVDFQGRYDVLNRTYFTGNAGYQHLSLPTTSPNNATGNDAQTFDVYKAGASFYRGAGLLHAYAGYDIKRLSYNNAATPNGGGDQTLFDRDQHTMSGGVSYELTENLKPYFKGRYNWRDYDRNAVRQSQGYDGVVGATADFGGITSLDAYVGWISQNYENFANDNVNRGVKFGGRLDWNVTGLTSVALEVNRSVEETSVANFNSFMATGGSATVTHELLRNLLVEGDFSFTRNAFQGFGTREDDQVVAGTGVRWLINRNLYADVNYNWQRRLSSAANADFLKHVVALRLGVQM